MGGTINSICGVGLACNSEDATFRMYVLGSYGRFYYEHLSNICWPFVFANIGANQDLYTIIAAGNWFSAKYHSFLPNKKTYDLLKTKMKVIRLNEKCEAHEFGLSDSHGKANLRLSGGDSGGASLMKGGDFGDMNISVETNGSKELDDLLAANDLPLFCQSGC